MIILCLLEGIHSHKRCLLCAEKGFPRENNGKTRKEVEEWQGDFHCPEACFPSFCFVLMILTAKIYKKSRTAKEFGSFFVIYFIILFYLSFQASKQSPHSSYARSFFVLLYAIFYGNCIVFQKKTYLCTEMSDTHEY